jgi:Riboflavin synthase beta-chain
MATTNLSYYDKATIPNAKNFRFGIVVSEWNPEITQNLKKGAIDTLLNCGALNNNITTWDVPGSFELVYGCKKMITSKKVDAIIAIGNVIQGETKHFDFVCDG